ncbi:MAG: FAD-dependent oxidoreductase [Candidatus Binataceae bacterium]|jgi:2,4-dienoyl-CoA reductase-like NADH-dependent reductase (Old Yellow Enzyme family)/thioredoxin reductase
MAAQYPHLFSPLKIGPITIKNRIIFGPHVTCHWSSDFLATPRAKAYYEERARGGVGMIIVGAASVDGTADYYPFTQPGIWKDEVIPGLKEITDAVHKHGAKIVQQILHPGVHQIPERDPRYPGRAPSQIPAIEEPFYIPKELEVEEIIEIEDKFADAAERVKKAGYDGVEVHGAHGYLVWAFLTPLKNKRTDQYGGSLENRFRFYREILEKVRKRVGPDFVVGTRIISSDLYPGGLDVEDSARIAKMIEETKTVDFINVSIGMYRSVSMMIPSHYSGFEPGYQGEFTRKIKAEIKTLPVFQVGKINDPALAEHIVAEGGADAVVLIRELIAEPHFARKAQEGNIEELRPCMYCNQKCVAHIFTPGAHVECNGNPVTGEEFNWGSDFPLIRAATKKKVLIIGAGPGGLECARIAAERGHDVVMYEKGSVVGGQMQLMTKLPGREEPRNLMDWLERQAKGKGARINFNAEVNAQNADEILKRERPDAVVVATGARGARDGRSSITTEPVPGWERSNVFSYEEILEGTAKIMGKRVVILDELGDRITPGIAEMLTGDGKEVHVITRWPNLSHFWANFWLELPLIYGKMDELGVKITSSSWIKEITASGLTCFNVFSSREFAVPADAVIMVTMKYSNMEPYKMLKEKGVKPIYLMGDAKSPRQIGDALRDGHTIGREL